MKERHLEFSPRLTQRPGNEALLSCFLGLPVLSIFSQAAQAFSTLSESQSRHSLLINIPVLASSCQPAIQIWFKNVSLLLHPAPRAYGE